MWSCGGNLPSHPPAVLSKCEVSKQLFHEKEVLHAEVLAVNFLRKRKEEPLRLYASALWSRSMWEETPFSRASHERAMAMKPTSEM